MKLTTSAVSGPGPWSWSSSFSRLVPRGLVRESPASVRKLAGLPLRVAARVSHAVPASKRLSPNHWLRPPRITPVLNTRAVRARLVGEVCAHSRHRASARRAGVPFPEIRPPLFVGLYLLFAGTIDGRREQLGRAAQALDGLV